MSRDLRVRAPGRGMSVDGERLARIALCHHTQPGHPDVLQWIAAHGAQSAWRKLLEQPRLQARLAAVDPQQDLRRLEACGGRVLIPGDDEWPGEQLQELTWVMGSGKRSADGSAWAGEPYALWVRGKGDVRELTQHAVAIVGARGSTDEGVSTAKSFASGLVARGWSVISGGAYGVDAAAHLGALDSGGATIAVMACGVDVAYPPAHDRLFDRIAATGCVISELPPGAGVRRELFLHRNRLIAALSQGTLVVEAAARSGALSTARHAMRLQRQTFAAPGRLSSPMSVGAHALIREGYTMLATCAADIDHDLGPIAPMQLSLAAPVARDGLSRLARQVLDAFPAHGVFPPSALADACCASVAEVNAELESLLEAGFVELAPDGFQLTAAARLSSDRESL